MQARNMGLVLGLVCLSLVLGCQNRDLSQEKIAGIATVSSKGVDPVFTFAKSELMYFVHKPDGPFVMETSGAKQGHWHFALEVDANLPPYVFAVECEDRGDSYTVHLTGHDPTCVAHAVFTMLEKLGYRFQLTGPMVPDQINLDDLIGYNETIRPAVQLRGPRPYVNFTMDISGYPLREVREYIRNLARMRFNLFSFHSYRLQWYAFEHGNTKELAGNFFYGQRHDIPDDPFFKDNIRNEKTFCIPAIEPYYDIPELKSKHAINWMSGLMDEAKRCGLTVQMSFEPDRMDTDVNETIARCEAIADTYPQLDHLEIITLELGNWRKPYSPNELRLKAEEHFDDAIIEQTGLSLLFKEKQNSLYELLGQVGHNIKAVQAVHKLWQDRADRPQICVGAYCSVPAYHETLFNLFEQTVPEDIPLTILPGHGANRDYKYLRNANLTAEELKRLMIIQWLEFDGNMYQLQNSVHGIYQGLSDAFKALEDDALYGMSFIHWRNAESQVTARYAALATLMGPIEPNAFYHQYAADMGIGGVEHFIQAVKTVDQINEEHVDDLCIGFCFLPCWGTDEMLLYNRPKERQQKARHAYEQALAELGECAKQTACPQAKHYLAFLDNRIRCTILYFRAFERATDLVPIMRGKQPEDLGADEKRQIVDICNEVLLIFDQYMKLHVEQMPDRGCEGNLISFYCTAPLYIKRIRADYGGVSIDAAAMTDNTIDAPPMPIVAE